MNSSPRLAPGSSTMLRGRGATFSFRRRGRSCDPFRDRLGLFSAEAASIDMRLRLIGDQSMQGRQRSGLKPLFAPGGAPAHKPFEVDLAARRRDADARHADVLVAALI